MWQRSLLRSFFCSARLEKRTGFAFVGVESDAAKYLWATTVTSPLAVFLPYTTDRTFEIYCSGGFLSIYLSLCVCRLYFDVLEEPVAKLVSSLDIAASGIEKSATFACTICIRAFLYVLVSRPREISLTHHQPQGWCFWQPLLLLLLLLCFEYLCREKTLPIRSALLFCFVWVCHASRGHKAVRGWERGDSC